MWHYVGKIGQRLKEQINQYIPTNVHNLHQCVNTPDSAIAGHLLKKKTANVPNLTTKTDILSILKKVNSEFNLQLTEFVYIKSDQFGKI